MAGEAPQQASGIGADSFSRLLANLQATSNLFGGGGQSETSIQSGKNITPEQVQALIASYASGTNGLAATLSGQRTAGLYGSPIQALLAQKFMSEAAAQAAAQSTPTTVSRTTQTAKGAMPSAMQKIAGTAGLLGTGVGLTKEAKAAYNWLKEQDLLGATGVSGMDALAYTPAGIAEAQAADAANWGAMFSEPATDYSNLFGAIPGAGIGTTGLQSAFGLGSFTDTAADADAWISSLTPYESFDVSSVQELAAPFLSDLGSVDAASWGADFGSGAGLEGAADFAGSAASGIPYASIGLNALDGEWGWNDTGAVVGNALLPGIGGPIGSAIGEPVGEVIEGVGGAVEGLVEDIGGGTVICTELYRQDLMPSHIYEADTAYGKLQSPELIVGYHFWAKPLVSLMRKSPFVTWIVYEIATPWSKEMAYRMGVLDKGSLRGKLLMLTMYPICKLIGKVILAKEEVSYG